MWRLVGLGADLTRARAGGATLRLIDWLDGHRVLLLSPCSGHGFKFASLIGEIAAQLLTTGRAWMDLAPFALRRFAPSRT